MASIEFVKVHEYRDEIVAEACISGDEIDLEVRSYQFEPLSESRVAPKGEFDGDWREDVVQALEEAGYSIESDGERATV